jgi:hypothetical protein
MPKVELGTFGVVAAEELKIENKKLPVGGAFCVLGVLWVSAEHHRHYRHQSVPARGDFWALGVLCNERKKYLPGVLFGRVF